MANNTGSRDGGTLREQEMLNFNSRRSLLVVAALTGLVWAAADPTVAAEWGCGWGRTGPDSLKEFQDVIWINSHSGQRPYPF